MKEFITKEYFGIIVLLIALVPQVAHTVHVFESNSHYPNPWFAWPYAISVDLAILIFTVRGWIWTAVGYLLATLAHNFAYHFLPEQSEWGSALIGVTLSITIFSFSHVFYTGKKRTKSAIDDAILDLAKRLSSEVQAGIYLP